MKNTGRCLYNSALDSFLAKDCESIFGSLCDNYHGDTLTTTREAWMGEINILKRELSSWQNTNAQIVFEYDIPRLAKRIDVVLLLEGIVFCNRRYNAPLRELNQQDRGSHILQGPERILVY